MRAPARVAGRTERVDAFVRKMLEAVCGALLVSTVVFTGYTVMMRYVFENPPFWGDTLTMLANIWFVMLAAALAIRNREQIAMQALYDWIPVKASFGLELVWNSAIVLFGIFLAIVGVQTAIRTPGEFWELGRLPKSVVMAVMPISGVLMVASAVRVMVEDVRRFTTTGDWRPVARDPE